MSKSEYSLTKFLWSTSSGLAKLTTVLLIFSLIIGGYTLADANIQNYRTAIDSGDTINYTFETQSYGDLQVAILSIDPPKSHNDHEYSRYTSEWRENADIMEVTIKNANSGNVIYKSTVVGGQIVNLEVEKGTYTIIVMNTNDSQIDVVIGNAQMDIEALWLSAIMIALLGISIGFLFTILPFLIFALVFKAVSEYVPSDKQTQRSSQSRERIVSTMNIKSRRMLLETNPGSMMLDVTNKDRVLASVAIFFAIFSVLEGSISFFFFLFSIIVIVNVTRRNSIRIKLTNLLYQNGSTNITEATMALSQRSSKHIRKTLNFMILELGYPITFNNLTGVIEVNGDLTPFLPYAPSRPTANVSSSQSEATQVPVEKKTTTAFDDKKTGNLDNKETDNLDNKNSVSFEKNPQKTTTTNCNACGSNLPSEAAFCHNCGAKQRYF